MTAQEKIAAARARVNAKQAEREAAIAKEQADIKAELEKLRQQKS